jgi:C-terminal processing protease CtpA/Prc
MPDGSRFEGVGIQPDIEVKLTRKDLYKSRDRVLEIAVEEAEKLLINSDLN